MVHRLSEEVEFTEYCPAIFHSIREAYGIDAIYAE